MTLYRSTVDYNPVLCHLCTLLHLSVFLSIRRCVWCFSALSLVNTWSCVVACESRESASIRERRLSRSFKHLLVVLEHICKNNKVTKHELLNLQLLFTLIIFLAWGGWYILQEAGGLLGYLLWVFTLNLSQTCFNCLERHQKCTLQGLLCIPYYHFLPLCIGVLHSLCSISSPLICYSLQTRCSRPTTAKMPHSKDHNHVLEQFLWSSTSLTTKGESGGVGGRLCIAEKSS